MEKQITFKYSNKNFITIIPVIALVITPITKEASIIKSLSLYSVAPKTIGVDNIKEYLAAPSLETPIILPVVIVIPDLETPGMNANA